MPINLPSLPDLLDGSLWWVGMIAIFLGVVLVYALAGVYRAFYEDAREWFK